MLLAIQSESVGLQNFTSLVCGDFSQLGGTLVESKADKSV